MSASTNIQRKSNRRCTSSLLVTFVAALIAAIGLLFIAVERTDAQTQGEVWAWGDNQNGALGDGTTTSSNTPVQVSGLSDVQAIDGGGSDSVGHSLGLKNDGSVWVWGRNQEGQLGDGTNTQRITPVQVRGLSSVQAIAAGAQHSLAIGSFEQPLPDLTVDKTGPSTATPAPDEFVTYNIDVTNVGSGDAVLPSGAVLVRDVTTSRAGILQGSSAGNFLTIEGVTGLPVGIDVEYPGNTRTRLITDMVNPERESSDATISPGGALRGASVGVDTKAPGGQIINCATVDPDNVIFESDETNNVDCVTTQIRP